MDDQELFRHCLSQASTVIQQVQPEHFANPTPDSDWNVRDLVAHMLYEIAWVPDILAGQKIEAVGTKFDGNLIGDDDYRLSIRWQTIADMAEAAAVAVDPERTVYLSYGERSAAGYLRQAATDQLIHAWDLGKAIGFPVRFEPAVAQLLYDENLPKGDEMKATGLFAPRLEVAVPADLQTKLLALFGRRADWSPPRSEH